MIKPFNEPIYVTRPFLPDIEQYRSGMEEIWQNKWLTNDGPFIRRFAEKLSRYFQSNNICLFNNGTLALQIALQGMEISGEVITTPYTFVATTHALFWNKIRPVFVDIEPDYYTIDPEKIEAAITPWTTAILAVHVYGNPCNLVKLSEIAKRNNLKLIYDAAHSFGVNVDGQSIANFGDLSMFSFHATKLFHSIEGGMLIFNESGYKKKFDYLKNFGFENEVEVVMPGTNAKMNEFQALMGELVLKDIDAIIDERKSISNHYRKLLSGIPGLKPAKIPPKSVEYNYAYMPIEIFSDEFGMSRDILYEELKKYNVFSRRYFYPLVCDYPCYRSVTIKDSLKESRAIASRIITLPIFNGLDFKSVEKICAIIRHLHENAIKSGQECLLNKIA